MPVLETEFQAFDDAVRVVGTFIQIRGQRQASNGLILAELNVRKRDDSGHNTVVSRHHLVLVNLGGQGDAELIALADRLELDQLPFELNVDPIENRLDLGADSSALKYPATSRSTSFCR